MADDKNRTFTFTDFNNLNDSNRLSSDLNNADVLRNLNRERKALEDEFAKLEVECQNIANQIQSTSSNEEKRKLTQTYNIASKKKLAIKHKLSVINEQINIYNKDATSYTNLYNAKDSIAKDDSIKEAKISTDENGKLQLVLDVMRPSPFSFSIHDGRITLDNVNVSNDQLKEMLEILDKMGIKNIQLPDELDKQLKDNMQSAIDERNHQDDANYSKDSQPVFMTGGNEASANGEGEQSTPNQASNNAQNAAGNSEAPIIPGINPEFAPASTAQLPQAAPAPQYAYDYKEFKHKVEFDILQRNMGKIGGLSYFHVKQGGYDKWYVYDTQNPDNYDNDGKRGKDGTVAVKNQFVIWAKEKENGKIELGYSMPNGKPIGNALADKLITLHKDRGATHIKFNDMTDDDASVFRTRCARLGIVPVGIGINEKHAQEMIAEAAKKLSDQEFQTYKWRLAQQMRKNIRNSGKSFEDDRSAAYIKELEGDFKFNPFKTAYDDVFKGIIEREKRSRKAENAIGAVNTMEKIFEAYRGGMERDDPGSITLAEVLNPQNNLFTAEEIQAIQAKFAESGKPLPSDQSMNKLNKNDLGLMFEAVLPLQQKQAAEDLARETQRYTSAKEKDDTVKDEIDNANAKMDRIAGELEQKGIKKMYFARINRSMKFSGLDHSTPQQQQQQIIQNSQER